MRRHLLAFAPALLVLACFEAAFAIVAPVISLRLEERGTDATTIGLIAAAYSLGYLGGTQICRPLLGRYGLARALGGFCLAGAAAIAAHVVFAGLAAWFFLSLLCGALMAGLYFTIEALLNALAENGIRGRLYGAYLTISWSAGAIAPFTLIFDRPGGQALFLFAAAILCAGLLPLYRGRKLPALPSAALRKNATGLGFALPAISPLALIVAFVSGMENGALHGLLPSYVFDLGFAESQLSLLLAGVVLAGLAAQWPIGHLSDRVRRRGILVGACFGLAALFALGVALLPPALSGFPVLAVAIAAVSAAAAPAYALGAAIANDAAGRRGDPSPIGALLFGNGLGAAIGPLAAGSAMDRLGPQGLFLFIALGAGLAAFAAALLAKEETAEPQPISNLMP